MREAARSESKQGIGQENDDTVLKPVLTGEDDNEAETDEALDALSDVSDISDLPADR